MSKNCESVRTSTNSISISTIMTWLRGNCCMIKQWVNSRDRKRRGRYHGNKINIRYISRLRSRKHSSRNMRKCNRNRVVSIGWICNCNGRIRRKKGKRWSYNRKKRFKRDKSINFVKRRDRKNSKIKNESKCTPRPYLTKRTCKLCKSKTSVK